MCNEIQPSIYFSLFNRLVTMDDEFDDSGIDWSAITLPGEEGYTNETATTSPAIPNSNNVVGQSYNNASVTSNQYQQQPNQNNYQRNSNHQSEYRSQHQPFQNSQHNTSNNNATPVNPYLSQRQQQPSNNRNTIQQSQASSTRIQNAYTNNNSSGQNYNRSNNVQTANNTSYNQPAASQNFATNNYSTNSNMTNHNVASSQSRNDAQDTIQKQKEQIEKLQALIAQKDVQMFDLESSMVTVKAETSFQIKQNQSALQKELRESQDHIRQLERDLNTKNNTIVKLNKRKRQSTEFDAGNRNHGLQSHTHASSLQNVNPNIARPQVVTHSNSPQNDKGRDEDVLMSNREDGAVLQISPMASDQIQTLNHTPLEENQKKQNLMLWQSTRQVKMSQDIVDIVVRLIEYNDKIALGMYNVYEGIEAGEDVHDTVSRQEKSTQSELNICGYIKSLLISFLQQYCTVDDIRLGTVATLVSQESVSTRVNDVEHRPDIDFLAFELIRMATSIYAASTYYDAALVPVIAILIKLCELCPRSIRADIMNICKNKDNEAKTSSSGAHSRIRGLSTRYQQRLNDIKVYESLMRNHLKLNPLRIREQEMLSMSLFKALSQIMIGPSLEEYNSMDLTGRDNCRKLQLQSCRLVSLLLSIPSDSMSEFIINHVLVDGLNSNQDLVSILERGMTKDMTTCSRRRALIQDTTKNTNLQAFDETSESSLQSRILIRKAVVGLLCDVLQSPIIMDFMINSSYKSVYHEGTTILTKLFACVLDDLQYQVLPSIGQMRDVQNFEIPLLVLKLEYGIALLNLLTSISGNASGFEYILSHQDSNENLHNKYLSNFVSCLSLLADVLEKFAKIALEYTNSEERELKVCIRNNIESCVSFFHTLHIQSQRRSASSRKSLSFSGLVYEADRLRTFVNSCEMVVSMPDDLYSIVVVSSSAKQKALALLEALSDD